MMDIEGKTESYRSKLNALYQATWGRDIDANGLAWFGGNLANEKTTWPDVVSNVVREWKESLPTQATL